MKTTLRKMRWIPFFIAVFLVTFGVGFDRSVLFAEHRAHGEGKYHIQQVTPEIHEAFARRKARVDTLNQLKAHHSVGEDNLGHVANLSGLPEVQLVVDAENYDRELIYQAIVDQNKLGPEAIQTVRSVFAQVRRDKAKPGDKIQMPNGEWMVK